VGAVVSIIALSAAYTFGASLDHAVATPRLFGQQWDAIVDGQFSGIITGALHVDDDPSFEAVAGGSYGTIVVGGTVVPAVGIDQLRGSTFPTLLEGRAPSRPDEIVLGSSTLKRIHKQVGDNVEVPGDTALRSLRIVGRSVFPAFGIGGFSPTSLGEGAALTIEGLGGSDLPPGQYSFLLVRYTDRPGAESVRRVNNACEIAVNEENNLCYVLRRQAPPEISSYADVRNVPWLLTGLLAALAAATLAHGLLATVRRRRRDLAILKTLGFKRRQISATVAWQATTLALIALIGIPFGVVLGRWGWTALADQLGIPAEPRTPLGAIVLTIPAALILANLAAALPARSAARTRPALVLRSE
jgi:putative ABC transport system permease protein